MLTSVDIYAKRYKHIIISELLILTISTKNLKPKMTTIFFTILLHFIGQTTLSSTAELMMKRRWAAALVNVAVKVQIKPRRDQSSGGGRWSDGVDIRAFWLSGPNPSRASVRLAEPCVPPPPLRTIAAQWANQPPHHVRLFIHFPSSLLTSLVMPLAALALQHTAPTRNWVQNSLIAFQRRIKVVC